MNFLSITRIFRNKPEYWLFSFFALLTVVFLLTSCSTVNKASSELDAKAKTFSPPEGKALVYVIWGSETLPGKEPNVALLLNGQFVAGLEDGSYAVLDLFPGTYTFSVTLNSQYQSNPLELQVQERMVYFLEADKKVFRKPSDLISIDSPRSVLTGVGATPGLKIISEELGRKMVLKYELVVSL